MLVLSPAVPLPWLHSPDRLGPPTSGNPSAGARFTANHARTAPPPASPTLSTQFTLDLWNNTVLRGDSVGISSNDPAYAAYDTERNLLYVSDGTQLVLEVDPSTFQVVGTLDATGEAGPMIYLPASQQLWIESLGSVIAFDPTADRALADFPVATASVNNAFVASPVMAYVPPEDELFIAGTIGDPNEAYATIFSLTSDSVVGTVQVGTYSQAPGPSSYDPVNHRFYSEDYWSDIVRVYDPSTWNEVTSISLQNVSAGILSGLGIDSLNGIVYVSSRGGTLVAVSGANNSVVASRSLGTYPSGIAFDPSSDELYVADSKEQALFAIAPESLDLLTTVPFFNASQPVVNDWWPIDVPALGSVFVPEGTTAIVAGVDAAAGALFSALDTDPHPQAEAWDPGCACLAVGVANLDRLYFVNVSRLQVESFVPLPGTPYSLLYLPGTNELEVSMQGEFTGSQGIALLNASDGSLVMENSAVAYPTEAAFDASSGTIFVPEQAAQVVAGVSVKNGSVLSTTPVGLDPTVAAYGPGANEVLVANQVSSNLTVLNATTGAEIGSIPLASSPGSLAIDAMTDRLYVGTGLNVSVFDLGDSNFVGSLAVASANAIVLDPSNVTAYFTNGTGDVIEASMSDGAVTQVAAGDSLQSLVEVPSGALVAIDPQHDGIYDVGGAPSNFLYNASFSVAPYVAAAGGGVTFQIEAPTALGPFQVAFSGLPAGCTAANVVLLSCTPMVAGTYQVGAVLTDPAGQSAARSLRLWLLPGGFDVTVNETGLPDRTPWWFNVSSGASYESVGRELSTPLLDGNYSYSLGTTAAGWRAPGGAFQVANSEVWLPVLFTEPTYAVTVSETGLPVGTTWTIVIGSVPASTSTIALQRFSLANGTYLFNASAPNSTGWLPSNGSFVVQGAAVGTSARFAPVVPVIATFTAAPSQLALGTTVRLSVQASAGTAPLTLTYSDLPGGCSSENETPLLCTPNATGAYTIVVQVRSSAGGVAAANTSIEVGPSPTGASTTPRWSDPFFLGAGLLLAGAMVTILLLVLRHRGRRAAASGSEEPATGRT